MIEKYKKLLQDSENAILVDDENLGIDIQNWLLKMTIEESTLLVHVFKTYNDRILFFKVAKMMPMRKIFVKIIKNYVTLFPKMYNTNKLSDPEKVSEYLKSLEKKYSELVEYAKGK